MPHPDSASQPRQILAPYTRPNAMPVWLEPANTGAYTLRPPDYQSGSGIKPPKRTPKNTPNTTRAEQPQGHNLRALARAFLSGYGTAGAAGYYHRRSRQNPVHLLSHDLAWPLRCHFGIGHAPDSRIARPDLDPAAAHSSHSTNPLMTAVGAPVDFPIVRLLRDNPSTAHGTHVIFKNPSHHHSNLNWDQRPWGCPTNPNAIGFMVSRNSATNIST